MGFWQMCFYPGEFMLASVSGREKPNTIKIWYDFEQWLDPWLRPFLAIPFNFWLVQLVTWNTAPSEADCPLHCTVLMAVLSGPSYRSVTPSSLSTCVTTNLKRCNFLGSFICRRWIGGWAWRTGSDPHGRTREGTRLCPLSHRPREVVGWRLWKNAGSAVSHRLGFMSV